MKEECWLLLAFQGQVTQTLFRCEWCCRGSGCCYSLPSCIMRHIYVCVCVCERRERKVDDPMLSGARWWRRLLVEVWDLPSHKRTHYPVWICTCSAFCLCPSWGISYNQHIAFWFHLSSTVCRSGRYLNIPLCRCQCDEWVSVQMLKTSAFSNILLSVSSLKCEHIFSFFE